MRRIVILGCSGSGKTTLAVQLGERLDLPVVHLDRLYWEPGWQLPDPGAFLARTAAALAGDGWISEGNYRETFPLRLPRADVVIVVQCPRWRRLRRVLWRSLFERDTRPDLPAGCQDRLNWPLLKFIWRFDRVTWPGIEAARQAHGRGVPVIRLGSPGEIATFLASLPRS